MQLSRLVLAVLALLLASGARADDRVMTTGYFYADSLGVLVGAPMASVSKDVSEEVSLNARMVVDSVTSASRNIDAITSASMEVRAQGTVGMQWERGYNRTTGLVEHGREPDYVSTTTGLGYARDFASRCTTVEVFWWHGFDRIDPILIGDGTDEIRTKDTDSYRVSLTQVLGPGTVLTGTYNFAYVRGYQSNPYYADVVTQAEQSPLYINDQNPEERRRHAASLRLAQWLPPHSALHPVVRLYSDDWGVRSLTSELRYALQATESLRVGTRYRFYAQTASEWHRDVYSRSDIDALAFHTLDFKYDEMVAHLAGGNALIDLERIRKALRADAIDTIEAHASYDFYRQQHGADWTFFAHIGHAGLSTTF